MKRILAIAIVFLLAVPCFGAEVTKIDGKQAEYQIIFDGPKDRNLSVHIGGKDELTESKFKSEIRAERWGGEVYLKIANDNISPETASFSDNKITLDAGGIKQRFYHTTVNLEALDATRQDDALEWEVEFANPPPSNKLTYNIDFPTGLRFLYQPALTKDEIDEGCSRPDNVVGSYAVYWSQRNNKYMAGKFCHIYRPKLTDADGKWKWAEISIDSISKTLTFTIDLSWMATAKYPVVLGGTQLGKTDVGGSEANANDDFVWAFQVGTSGAGDGGMSLDWIAWYNAESITATSDARLTLYKDGDADDEPDALCDYTAEAALGQDAWNKWAPTQSYNIEASTLYFAGPWMEANDQEYAYDNDGSYSNFYDSETYDGGAPPANHSNNALGSGRRVSAYIEYSAAAGGGIQPSLVNGGLINSGLINQGLSD